MHNFLFDINSAVISPDKILFDITLIKNPSSKDSSPLYRGFKELHKKTFGEELTQKMENDLERKYNCAVWVAHDNEKVLGFKLGYELDFETYYSWRGAVYEKYRKNGIGSALMIAQHNWIKENGYKRVQTKTRNKWRHMLILNLKHGFNITGTTLDEKETMKIVLEKEL
jgi:GNAT superfamily N-acetyltransferase